MSVLGKFWQTPTERKRYYIDYSDWLDTDNGEIITSVSFVAVPPANNIPVVPVVFAPAISTSGQQVSVFVSGGDNLVNYQCIVSIVTNAGQNKDDEFFVNIKAL